ncbi:hypothetical protein [Sphingomonas japonica]|uniref:DNA transfer protein n=1 Tax=Sphingomonas japonica TaxID=511662 RepID=A0ABX0U6G3_9SPHN|nr:hypothetical protein [Sphingomonas japonica]NIJ24837.1 hypothetical protein [Sphingomonas japonica]
MTAITDQLGSLVPGLLDQYKTGDPNVNAAKSYNMDVLSGKYLNGNPYLDDIVQQTGDDVRNGVSASLGTRGLVGGSAQSDIVSRNLANNSNTLRYTDYNNQMQRMDGAVGQATGLNAASQLPLASLLEIAQAQQMPVQAASGAGSAIGGLLGQYTNQTQKSSPSLGAILAQIAGNAANTYASGGFG